MTIFCRFHSDAGRADDENGHLLERSDHTRTVLAFHSRQILSGAANNSIRNGSHRHDAMQQGIID